MKNRQSKTNKPWLGAPFKMAAPALALLLLGGGSGARADGDRDHGPIQIPAALEVPASNTLAFRARGIGVQIYTWTVNPTNTALSSWVFQAPHAVLFQDDRGVFAIHYAGPSWQNDDGSKVVGMKLASVTVDTNAIPWLLLKGTSTGPGLFADVTYVQRLNTEGGLAPSTPGLVNGQQALVPYSAEYWFYRADSPVFSIDSRPYGASYPEWAARFWQFKLSLPVDAASEAAPLSAGQSGPVWILARPGLGSVTETDEFSVPAGTALLLEPDGVTSDDSDCPTYDPFTVEELREFNCVSWGGVTEIICTLDGVAVPAANDPVNTPYLIDTPEYSYTLANHDNIWAVIDGLTCIPDGATIGPAVAEGVFVMFKPLPVGPHTIHTVGVVGPIASPHVLIDRTYQFTVTPAPDQE